MSEPILEVSIIPDEVFFQGISPGKVHKATFTLTNEGNVPVEIPVATFPNLEDPDLVAKELFQAIRLTKEDDSTKVLDTLVKSLRKYTSEQVIVSIKETGKKVEPGKSLTLHLEFKLPSITKGLYYFEGDIDIMTASVFFKIGP